MRYILRNQKKIEKAYGKKVLERINLSLKNHFDKSKSLDLILCSGDKLLTLIIDDSNHTSNMIAFYRISRLYDVTTLALKEFIG